MPAAPTTPTNLCIYYVSKVQKIDDSINLQMHLNKNICFSFYIEAGPAYEGLRDQEKNQSLEIKSFHQALRFMGLLMEISAPKDLIDFTPSRLYVICES